MNTCGAIIIENSASIEKEIELKQQVMLLERSGIKRILIVSRNESYCTTILKDTRAVIMENDGHLKTVLHIVRKGISRLKRYCDRIFVFTTTGINSDEISDMMERDEDVVLLITKGKEDKVVLFGPRLLNWCLIYNGNRGIDGIWKGLADIREISCAKMYRKENREIPLALRSVINWT